MIKSKSYKAIVTAVLILDVLAPVSAMAQSYPMATMPTLYNSANQAVNVGNTTPLAAGYYYLSPGSQQVYYYGNGTYYNAATGMYGGSATNNPYGTAGVGLGYSTAVGSPVVFTGSTPGVPNTGAGGEATATWITLAISGALVISGIAYLATTNRQVAK